MRAHRLVLVVPGVLERPAPGDEPRVTSDGAPHLARIVAGAGAPSVSPDGIEGVLAPLYGIARQSDWPLAPIRAQSLGVDVSSDFWLCADPVTLVASRDNVLLEGAVTDITAVETTELLQTLNAHFAGDDLAFIAPDPIQWFVHASAVPSMATRPLAAAVGQPLRELLPTGTDAGKWRRWQNEIQMLLFEHPTNAARERTGRSPVNSVWFSGGGTRPEASSTTVHTMAAGGTAAALAAFIGAPAQPLPASLDPLPLHGANDRTVVIAYDAASDIAAADKALFAPAWNHLCSGAVRSLTLITDGAGDAVVWTVDRPSTWQRLASRWKTPDLARLLSQARGE